MLNASACNLQPHRRSQRKGVVSFARGNSTQYGANDVPQRRQRGDPGMGVEIGRDDRIAVHSHSAKGQRPADTWLSVRYANLPKGPLGARVAQRGAYQEGLTKAHANFHALPTINMPFLANESTSLV
ncbi:hypothetical protein EJ06DRAFT_530400 [Trichodelitschia bisporula]|uniref:Uncharacterized protein n=1 Tax=Trichodelitschia bisporula TaxID=703511 RepID=A0A6G1HWI8_9PEZI|nr:hypothetical protein EJ06DRAFT_530400 [Trichodelitschia bisporula]